VWNTYIALRDYPDEDHAWWFTDDTFTPYDMLEWLLSMEFSGVASSIPHLTQMETTVRNFYTICADRGGWCNSRQENNVIEFIAAKKLLRQKGRNMVVPSGTHPAAIWTSVDPEWGTADFSWAFQNPGMWVNGYKEDYTFPMDWGNLSQIKNDNPQKAKEAESAPSGNTKDGPNTKYDRFYYKLGLGDSFIVLNFCQFQYWKMNKVSCR
jgi:hypothetical protein